MEDECEDWGKTFDDKDGSDWEDYLGGPDDDEIEGYCQDIVQTYEEDAEEVEIIDEAKFAPTMEQRDNDRWTRAEEAILVRGFRDNLGIPELGKRHLRSRTSIINKLLDLGSLNQSDMQQPDNYDVCPSLDEQLPESRQSIQSKVQRREDYYEDEEDLEERLSHYPGYLDSL